MALEIGGLTSTGTESHLFSLGEYCAMCLLVWSPDVWPPPPPHADEGGEDALPNIPDLPDAALRARLLGVDEATLPHLDGGTLPDDEEQPKEVQEQIEQVRAHVEALREAVREQHDAIQEFRAGVPRVRRALANVASYMIFDDHEVTDDWNLTRRWVERVQASPVGRMILRNGLLAYGLFQGEGNEPARYADEASPNGRLLARAGDLFPADADEPPVLAAAAEIDQLLGLGGDTPLVRWNYQVPGARHRVIVPDTRTRRIYAGEITPAALISPVEIDAQIPAGPLPAGIEALVVIAAAPVLGVPVIETLGQSLASRVGDFLHAIGRREHPGYQDPDMEAWAHDPIAFELLLERLAPYRRVIFLSGDVHYAAGAELSYWRQGDDAASRFVQFTSSGARNSWPAAVQSFVRSFSLAQRILRLLIPIEQLAWNEAQPNPVALPPETVPASALRFKLNQSPVLIPARGWPEGTQTTRPPDWSWRFKLLVDPRSAAELPEAARPAPLESDVEPAAGIDAYHAVARRHAQGLETATHTRRPLFPHNLGVVTFSRDGGRLMVHHELLSRHPHADPPDVPDVYTLHEARLDGTEETPPVIGGWS
ncbi:MAG: hypothetical protein ACRDI2_02020 [Chloroflexota bacterium]